MYWPVIFGSAVNLLGTSYYILNTLRGVTKPNRVTWLMWSIAPMIGAAAAYSAGVTWAVLPVFMSGFCPFLVFLASFANKNAYWHLGRFDYACGALSVLTLIFWYFTADPVIAIALAILSDAAAAVPTVMKSWHYPETETSTGFAAGGFNAFTSFFVISEWTFEQYGFSLYLVIANAVLVFLVIRRKLGFKR